jgi:hypothetical protein
MGRAERAMIQANGRIGAREACCVLFAFLKTLRKRRSAPARGRTGFLKGAMLCTNRTQRTSSDGQV